MRSLCSSAARRRWNTTGRQYHVLIDQLYAQLTSTRLNSKFFEAGFGFDRTPEYVGYGDLPSFHESVDEMRALVAAVDAPRIDMNKRGGYDLGGSLTAAEIYEGVFETPVPSTQRLLPAESKLAYVQYIVPKSPTKPVRSTVVHLAATGDHGFSRRRLAYALPLAIQHNIASVILESPFYGVRKPSFQNRSKLKTLSDLLLLGKATIEESLYVLRWLEGQRAGDGRSVMSGVSMGGVHACMVASVYGSRGDLGLVPLLAPKSASAAYCGGALKVATSWDGLQSDFESRDIPHLLHRIERDMRAGNVLSQVSEDSWRLLEHLQHAARAPTTVARYTTAMANSETPVRQLTELILNTYTDLTRFPPPHRADAAVVVGGSDDGYIGTQSVREVGEHLEGSEVRWVKGGHVSSFIMQHDSFVKAMVDCVEKLGA